VILFGAGVGQDGFGQLGKDTQGEHSFLDFLGLPSIGRLEHGKDY